MFTSTGSAQGRKDFGNQTTDFAVSDIGYQGKDPQTGDTDLPCKLGASSDCRAYAYLPIVSGGTSFPYHIEVAGRLVNNLRLSGETLTKIFTGAVTDWSDPQITRDNNGHALPSLPIIPVSHAEGSGSSAQFTLYMDSMYPSIYRAFEGGPGETEYFKAGGNGVQQTGSDGVINFITSAAANGSIGYDEYSYALNKNNYPVAKIENSAGYFTLPTQYNVAVALQKAQINQNKDSPDYLLQNLDQVYRYRDPRTYPLSSYSYMIIPTAANDSRMSTAKRQTLADFVYYSVCQGQAQVGPVGYSSLPLNLVQASFNQTAKLKQADPKVDITKRDVTTCNNPTFVPGHLDQNHLAQIAPQPPACDKSGAGPCVGSGDSGVAGVPSGNSPGGNAPGGNNPGGNAPGGNNPGGNAPGGNNPSGNAPGGNKPSGNAPGGSNPGGNAPGASTSTGAPAGGTSTSGNGTTINPDTGQVESSGSSSGTGSSDIAGTTTTLAAYRQQDLTNVLAPLAALEILAVLVVPPIFYYAVIRRRRKKTS